MGSSPQHPSRKERRGVDVDVDEARASRPNGDGQHHNGKEVYSTRSANYHLINRLEAITSMIRQIIV